MGQAEGAMGLGWSRLGGDGAGGAMGPGRDGASSSPWGCIVQREG